MQNNLKKAVALSYDEKDNAPKVIAGGKGEIAEKIIKTAKENDVPIFEQKELVDVLLQLELGSEIPKELYEIVAEILIFICHIDQMAGGKNDR